MAISTAAIEMVWEKPAGEAQWERAEPPADAQELERLAEEALASREAPDRAVRVTVRPDGTRHRVLAEYAVGSTTADRRTLTLAVVEALRRAGHPVEAGFPADPTEPQVPIGQLE